MGVWGGLLTGAVGGVVETGRLKALEGVCVFVITSSRELGVFEMVGVHLRSGHDR